MDSGRSNEENGAHKDTFLSEFSLGEFGRVRWGVLAALPLRQAIPSADYEVGENFQLLPPIPLYLYAPSLKENVLILNQRQKRERGGWGGRSGQAGREGGRQWHNKWGRERYGRKFVNFNGWMTSGKVETCEEDDFPREWETHFVLGLKIFLRPPSFPDPMIEPAPSVSTVFVVFSLLPV